MFRCLGCLFGIFFTVLGIIMLCLCVLVLLPSTCREPELSIDRLLEHQLEAFPADWGTRRVWAYTDDNATSARWMADVSFMPVNNDWHVTEEIHIYLSPTRARLFSVPSPAANTHYWPGSLPGNWSYHPPHADHFELRYHEKEGDANSCRILLRYEEYAFYIYVPVSGEITLGHVRKFLEITDREMAQHLANSTLKRGPRRIPEEWLEHLAPGERP